MTIASEITRLQNDKAAICTAIENKGVTVGNVTLDSYAACIDAIEQGGGGQFVDLLMVGGGGSGGCGCVTCNIGGGGGGAGGVIIRDKIYIDSTPCIISIGEGGSGGCSGGDTIFGELIALGGGHGGTGGAGASGGSGGGAAGTCCCLSTCRYGGDNIGLQGHSGGNVYSYNGTNNGGGGGGAGGRGLCSPSNTCVGCPRGGEGILSSIDGAEKCYAGGGGAGVSCQYSTVGACGQYGGGRGGGCSTKATSATTCGSGGGGGSGTPEANRVPGSGAGGIVIVRYAADGSYGITDAKGGCKYECNGYCIHCFTSGGTFNISSGCWIQYLVVGGGGGAGCYGGGGGGEVKSGLMLYETPISIEVGCGGEGLAVKTSGGDTCLGGIVARGGCVSTGCDGGVSGSGCIGGTGSTFYTGGGGGGAAGNGCNRVCCCGGAGGIGKFGYGGGGGGSGCTSNSQGGSGYDGGGKGGCSAGCNATNYGGGGGGARASNKGGNGCQGVVDICYPADGGLGFTTATGGDSCYLCDGMCVHRFTSNGTFTIVS